MGLLHARLSTVDLVRIYSGNRIKCRSHCSSSSLRSKAAKGGANALIVAAAARKVKTKVNFILVTGTMCRVPPSGWLLLSLGEGITCYPRFTEGGKKPLRCREIPGAPNKPHRGKKYHKDEIRLEESLTGLTRLCMSLYF